MIESSKGLKCDRTSNLIKAEQAVRGITPASFTERPPQPAPISPRVLGVGGLEALPVVLHNPKVRGGQARFPVRQMG